MQLVQADLLGAELIERLAEVFGEAFDVVGVGVDGPLREVADEHIAGHPLGDGGQGRF